MADPGLSERLAGKVSEQLEVFATQMRHGLLAASVAIGLDVMGELVDAEVTEIAGPKGRHDPTAARTGTAPRTARSPWAGGASRCAGPRVRTVADDDGVEREVHLESYDTFASVDLLADHMVASMLAGLSGRRYQRALEPVGEPVEQAASGTSQTSVSRRFITATAERLAEFRSRPLDDQRWLICFVDGFDFAGHTMVGALGVTADGTKVPLGVVEGSTENAVGRAWPDRRPARPRPGRLRGHPVRARRRQGARQAVRDVFGDQAVIARCRLHYAEQRIMPSRLVETLVGQGLRADALGIILELWSSLLSDVDAMRRGDHDGQTVSCSGEGTAGAVRVRVPGGARPAGLHVALGQQPATAHGAREPVARVPRAGGR